MASIINRIKTIVGSDATLFTGLSRILFYLWVSNPVAKVWNTSNRKKVAPNEKIANQDILSKYTETPITVELKQEVIGQPLVSIIIPTKNKATLVKQCIDSIIHQSTYVNYEIILVNNRSDEESFFALVNQYQQKGNNFTMVNADIEFNFSQLINHGRAAAKGEYLLLLNNDTEVITPSWIELLISVAQQPKIGAVGCKLLYPNKTIQHAGVMIEPNGTPRHVFVGVSEADPIVNITKTYPALTAAALMVGAQKFDETKGFDELFVVEYNDIDFCLKLIQQGYYNVYQSEVSLFHYESASRRHPFSDRKNYNRYKKETELFKTKWFK